MQAVKQMPDVAAALTAAAVTLLALLASLFGLIGASKAPAVRSRLTSGPKLTRIPQLKRTTTVKAVPDKPVSGAPELAPVAFAGEEENKALDAAGVEVPAVTKRVTRSAN